ncbi:helix-turn-helix transcriptional regulator [Saccharopolyspora sp. 7B]|uniref:ArsR/SmtB family transcription factor n=1 Tax=Saccharopolyspora sp. 7B TaxID=2877240 RepID=UPI001CD7F206|nr:metalloregulator ArsR/SmtB family transcription factor [Saccharopolyspora sp. 7B]MCA1282109.1 metalloregulator ArsR/SmtB family transcription factor [Saccharopolyspora sp. 7B]
MARNPDHPDLRDVRLDRIFAALGDQARLRIVAVLADRAEHQREDFAVEVGPSTLSHHMKVLREAGLVRCRFEGTRCFVSLRADVLQRHDTALDGVLRSLVRESA